MRQLKIVGAVIIAVVALTAVVAATASAAAPEFTPGKAGTTFTGTSGTGTLTAAGGTIECKEDSVKGELTGSKTGTATITFKGCAAFTFFGAKSLDAKAEGEILTKVKLLLCFVKNGTPLEVGLLTEVEKEVHVEVAGKLIAILGDAVGVITPLNTKTSKYTITYKQKNRVQEPAGCEKQKENLLAKENEKGVFENAGEATTESTTFAAEQTLVG